MVGVGTLEEFKRGSVDVTLIDEGVMLDEGMMLDEEVILDEEVTLDEEVMLDEEIELGRDVCEYTLILQAAPHTTAALA